MRTEVKTFKVKCDRCECTEITLAKHDYEALPKGWGTVTSGGWGSTDYTRTEDLCPICLEKENGKKKLRARDSARQG